MSMQQIMFASLASGGGHIIEGSGLFGGTTSDFLDGYVPSTPTDNNVWTYEAVVKLSAIGTIMSLLDSTSSDTVQAYIRFNADGVLRVFDYNSGVNHDVSAPGLHRDAAAYYHIVVAFNSGESTSTDRIKIYINGTQVTTTGTQPSLNAASYINTSGRELNIGKNRGGSVDSAFDGYFARATFIDGQALDPTSFGEITDEGFYQLNDVSDLTFGNNGFLLTGGSAISAGTDSSGNDNDFSKAGSIISTSDSPTSDADNGYGNYPTINPLEPKTANFTLSNGNRTYTSTGAQDNFPATFGISSGKIYWEVKPTALGYETAQFSVGIAASTWDRSTSAFGGQTDVWLLNTNAANTNYRNSGTAVTGITAVVANNTVQFAMDLDAQKLWIGRNNTWYGGGDPADGSDATYTNLTAGETYTPIYGGQSAGTNMSAIVKMQLADWTYDAPSGFGPLSTAVLSTPAIINPADHFHSVVVDHDGSSTASTCTFNLENFEWLAIIKNTTGAVEDWHMIDSVRGVTKVVTMNTTAAETTDANVLTVSGTTFTLGSTLGAKNYLVEFHKAGLAADTASNEEGSLNTTATSVNLVSGFAISTYTGTGANTNYGHGLNSAPEWTITKLRVGSTQGNYAWHVGLGAGTKVIYPHLTNAIDTATSIWNSTVPSATLNSLGTGVGVNTNTYTYVNWSWHSVEGYSAFGKYTGSNATDGPMISTGMSIGSLMVKVISTTNDWSYITSSIDTYNEADQTIRLNTTGIIADKGHFDLVSNGFKLRNTNGMVNAAQTYIYGAWGGQPMTDGSVDQSRAR